MVNTMIKKAVKIITAITLLILFQPAHATAKPVILYTDILSGPNTGGENNNGTYLSIFGKGFGPDRASVNGKVTINGTEVAVYKQWGAQSKVYDSHGIQVITVQSGPSVTSGPIVVAVNGEQSNNNHVFTVIPGNIIFVALNGNDANDGSFTSPKLNANSAANGMQAGDHLVLRGGTWQQPENNGGFIAFKSVDPGTSSAPIAVMGYPGEDVFLDGNNGTARIKWHSNHGSYSTWANLRMVNGGFHQATQSSPYATNIRIVNVKTGEWHKTGGGSGNIIGPVTNYSILGNEIHDIGDNKLYHGIYLSVQDIDLTDIEIGWNHFNDINWCETGIQNDPSASTNQCAGNAIQFYDGGSGPPYTRNVSIHDNVIHDVSKNGIALGSHSSTGYKVYNNLVYRTGQNYQGGIKFGYQDLEAEAYNNILYDNNIGFDFTGATSVVLKNNIVIATSGQDLTTQSGGFDWPSIIDDSHNIFFGGTTPLWADGAGTLNTDPILLDPSNDNFHLQSGSPAIDAGADVSSVVTKDFDGNPRPMDGDNNGTYLTDIGAYEYNGTYVPPNQSPIVSLNASPTSGTLTLTVNFTATASDSDGSIVKYEWDLNGDGTYESDTGTTFTTSYSYTTAGTYNAKVRVTDDDGATATDIETISVSSANQSPTVSLSANPSSGDTPLTVNFTATASDSDGTIASYEWDYDADGTYDQNTGATSTSSYTYASAATYNARVRVTDDDGATTTDITTITASAPVNQSPTVTLDAFPTSGTAPLTVDFNATASDSDGTIVSYEWDYDGDGTYDQNTGTTFTTSYSYTTAGTYNTKVRVIDDNGATSLDNITISVSTQINQPPTVSLSAAPTSGTVALSVNFSASASDTDGTIASYEWDFNGDGTYDQNTGTTSTSSYTYTSAAIYNARVRVTDDDGIAATDIATITASATVNQSPTVALGANPTSGTTPLTVDFNATASDSDGSIVSYEWDYNGDGTYDQNTGTSASSYTYTSAATYNAIVRVTDDDGATATNAVNIVVNAIDSDGDGVSDNEEGATYDGNGDGIADRLQSDVATLNTATGVGLITLYTGTGNLANVRSYDVSELPSTPEPLVVKEEDCKIFCKEFELTFEFPYGLYEFQITGLSSGENVQVALILPVVVPQDGSWYFFNSNVNSWEDFSSYTESLSDGDNVVLLNLTDGGPGDRDGLPNGTIEDPSGFTSTISNSLSGGCFIATAAYGSYLNPHVNVLRNFRDNYLLTNFIGKIFVNMYYFISPPIANIIKDNEFLKTSARFVLTPIVFGVKYPAITFMILGFILSIVVFKIKRKSLS
jgi:PKD repeat protein